MNWNISDIVCNFAIYVCYSNYQLNWILLFFSLQRKLKLANYSFSIFTWGKFCYGSYQSLFENIQAIRSQLL